MKRKAKGSFGYLEYQKKLKGSITAVCFAVIIAMVITAYYISGTRNNIITVVAILSVLPSSKFAVSFLMFLPHHAVSDSLKQQLENINNSFLTKYECVFTTNDKVVYVPALIITDSAVCAYTDNKGCNTEAFEEALKSYVKTAGININVFLLADEKQFIKKAEFITAAKKEAPSDEEIKKMQYIWESVSCMCM